MITGYIGQDLTIPIRLENVANVGIAGKAMSNINVSGASKSSTGWSATLTSAKGSSLTEWGDGDYKLTISGSQLVEGGFYAIKLSGATDPAIVAKEYIVQIETKGESSRPMIYVKQTDLVNDNPRIVIGPLLTSFGEAITALDYFGILTTDVGHAVIHAPNGDTIEIAGASEFISVTPLSGGLFAIQGLAVYSPINIALTGAGKATFILRNDEIVPYFQSTRLGSGVIQPFVMDINILGKNEYNKLFGISGDKVPNTNVVTIPADPVASSSLRATILCGPFVDTFGNPVTGLVASDLAGSKVMLVDSMTKHQDKYLGLNSGPYGSRLKISAADNDYIPGYYYISMDYDHSGSNTLNMFERCGNGKFIFSESSPTKYVPFEQNFYVEDVTARVRSIESIISNGNIGGMMLYVDSANGSNLNVGDSFDAALKTINTAITTIGTKPGVIFIKSGLYYEDVIVPPNVTLYGVYSDDNGGDDAVEIRGYDTASFAESLNPTITLYEGAKAVNLRIGRKDIGGTTLPALIRMKSGSQLLDCTIGGIDVPTTTIVSVSGFDCRINGNWFSGSDNANKAIILESGQAYNTIITNNTFNEILTNIIDGQNSNPNALIKGNSFLNLMNTYYAIYGYFAKSIFSDNKVYFDSANTLYRVAKSIGGGVLYQADNVSYAYSVWNYTPRVLTSGADQTMLSQIWQSTSGLAGEAMRGTDHVGSISADIISGGVVKKAGATIKDIEVRDNTVYVTYRDPADGKMKTFSVPFTQDVVIASGGDLI